MITLDDLRFIDALDRTGSLSAAARSLNVTPPAHRCGSRNWSAC
jgi:DNA-binding transcriptional LysR family regulator